MNGQGIPGGGVDLSNRGQVAIAKSRLLHVATFEVLDGGVIFEACRKHVRIIDIPQGTAYYVPLSDKQIQQAMEAFTS